MGRPEVEEEKVVVLVVLVVSEGWGEEDSYRCFQQYKGHYNVWGQSHLLVGHGANIHYHEAPGSLSSLHILWLLNMPYNTLLLKSHCQSVSSGPTQLKMSIR